jgi:chromosomal replication initiation ATPase DnaA
MSFSQISLEIWKPEYQANWLIGECNRQATETVLTCDGNIFLSGPRFCGKKHLASKLSQAQEFDLFILANMSDSQIIHAYDTQNKKAIWINEESLEFSNDVRSRLNSMHSALIEELSQDLFFPLLTQRFENLGFEIKEEIVNYCISRMERTFAGLESLIRFIKQNNRLSLSLIRQFLA